MTKIGQYGIYQKNDYDNTIQKQKESVKGKKTTKEEEMKKSSSVHLSKEAKALLQELKKKYNNMDFIVADYESDKEAAAYLSRSRKEYGVLIDPESLEKMATDDKTKEEYLSLIDKSTDELVDMEEQLNEEGKDKEVVHLGISIGKDGTVSYFAELEKTNEKQQERLEESRKERKAQKDKNWNRPEHPWEKNFMERPKRTTVTASSADELLEKIEQVDWMKVDPKEQGGRMDFSI